MGVVPPAPGFLEGLREVTRAARRAADLRRGHHRLPRRLRRRAGALRRASRPHVPRQDHRRRPAGRRLRRPRATSWSDVAPLGGVYQAGTLSGNPLAVAAGLATLARAARPASVYDAARGARRAARAAGCARRARKAGVPLTVNRVGSMLTAFFCAGPVRDYASARARRHRALRALLPRHARARRLPGAVAVRGRVRLARAHRRRPRRAPRAAAAEALARWPTAMRPDVSLRTIRCVTLTVRRASDMVHEHSRDPREGARLSMRQGGRGCARRRCSSPF